MRKVTDSEPTALDELRQMLGRRFDDLVKGVLDLRRGVLVLDAEMHADQEADLLADDPATRAPIAELVRRLVRR